MTLYFVSRTILTYPKIPANETVLPNLFTGSHNETARMTIFPWPIIQSGKPFDINITLTPGKLKMYNLTPSP